MLIELVRLTIQTGAILLSLAAHLRSARRRRFQLKMALYAFRLDVPIDEK